MPPKHTVMFMWMPIGAFSGGLVGLLLAPILPVSVSNILGALAFWAFEQWHSYGLPPHGEAALAGPYFAWLVQWAFVGALIAVSWRHLLGGRKRENT